MRNVTDCPLRSSSRFAVATFETWGGLQKAVDELCDKGLTADAFSCLGQRKLFAMKPPTLSDRGECELTFVDAPKAVCCTSGALAECLMSRLAAGATNLGAALAHWLIPRHAAEVQRAVLIGRIVFWVQLFDNTDERRAYDTLLANSSESVGVHDFVRK